MPHAAIDATRAILHTEAFYVKVLSSKLSSWQSPPSV